AAAASTQCWTQAAQSTAAFATFLGFTNVPSEGLPAPQSCTANASQDLQATRVSLASTHGVVVAHAAGVANDIFSDLMGIAGLSYSVFSGQGSSHQLSAIQGSLNKIQAEMVAVQNTL